MGLAFIVKKYVLRSAKLTSITQLAPPGTFRFVLIICLRVFYRCEVCGACPQAMLAGEDKYFEDLMRQLLQRFSGTAGARLLQVCLTDGILVSLPRME